MCTMTSAYIVCVMSVLISGIRDSNWLDNNIPDESVLNNYYVQLGMNIGLLCLGIMSLVLCFLHWHYSIEPLYSEPAAPLMTEVAEVETEEQRERRRLEESQEDDPPIEI